MSAELLDAMEAAQLLGVKWPLGMRKDLNPRPGVVEARRWSICRRLEHWARLAKSARSEERRHRAWLRYNLAQGLALIMIAHIHGEPITVEMTDYGLEVH